MAEPRTLHVWRHPRPIGAEGRCIGRTDVAVDPRKARRLAYRINAAARRLGLTRHVLTSTRRRTSDVGRCLRRLGWRHERIDALAEMDFGAWDGMAWTDVPRAAFDAWCADFLNGRPGGGESVDAFFDRVAGSVVEATAPVVVAHAGWLIALRWLADGGPRPVLAGEWPGAPGYAAYRRIAVPRADVA